MSQLCSKGSAVIIASGPRSHPGSQALPYPHLSLRWGSQSTERLRNLPKAPDGKQ